MWKIIKNGLYAGYLGGALAYLHITVSMPSFWIIMLGTIIFVNIREE